MGICVKKDTHKSSEKGESVRFLVFVSAATSAGFAGFL